MRNEVMDLHLFPPLALNDIRISVTKETNSGLTTTMNAILISSSSLFASSTWRGKHELIHKNNMADEIMQNTWILNINIKFYDVNRYLLEKSVWE